MRQYDLSLYLLVISFILPPLPLSSCPPPSLSLASSHPSPLPPLPSLPPHPSHVSLLQSSSSVCMLQRLVCCTYCNTVAVLSLATEPLDHGRERGGEMAVRNFPTLRGG